MTYVLNLWVLEVLCRFIKVWEFKLCMGEKRSLSP
jgi:hypothetical protein